MPKHRYRVNNSITYFAPNLNRVVTIWRCYCNKPLKHMGNTCGVVTLDKKL